MVVQPAPLRLKNTACETCQASNLANQQLETVIGSRAKDQLPDKSCVGSGLPQGPFFGEQPISPQSGFRMGFDQCSEMGAKVGNKWAFGCKNG